ncbi:MAG: hypothetical protein IPI60_16065 [Saprospiraceae bacterium]|nr:hypothetical protein [Saprospiraceae bacterium]
MPDFTIEQVKNIIGEIEMGFRVFYHKESGELLQVPGDGLDGMEGFEEEEEKLEENFSDYTELRKMDSRESFQIMESFAEQLSDRNPLKHRLFSALSQNRPFARFKQEIDHAGIFRDQWFDFKMEYQLEWYSERIERNNRYAENEEE